MLSVEASKADASRHYGFYIDGDIAKLPGGETADTAKVHLHVRFHGAMLTWPTCLVNMPALFVSVTSIVVEVGVLSNNVP